MSFHLFYLESDRILGLCKGGAGQNCIGQNCDNFSIVHNSKNWVCYVKTVTLRPVRPLLPSPSFSKDPFSQKTPTGERW